MDLSYQRGAPSPPLLDETIDANLRRTVAAYGERDALVSRHQGLRYTYEALDSEVDRVAKGLIALGVAHGDRVGIWSPNCAEWFLVQYATVRIGAILVCVNPAYRTSELEYVLNQSGCSVLVAAERYKSSDYRSMIEATRDALPELRHVVLLGTEQWKTFLQGGGAVTDAEIEARTAALRPNDPINIQYTSGTTGRPKGATLSHRNILNNGFMVAEGCRHSEADRICVPVPFYHCFGMVMGNLGATSHGSCVVVPAPTFDAAATLAGVAAEACTSLYGVPTMFIAMLAHPEFGRFDLSSLRTGIMAGSPCPVEVMKQVVERMHMAEVTICYGMTETSPVSTQTSATDPLQKRVGSVGRVHPHVEVKIADTDGEPVPRGEAGELCTRGYSVMAGGYWRDPERTAEAVDRDGWMWTGDLATMDADGYVNIVGRSKDMIIRGGENVSPREIEEFLYTHDDIVDVQVIGVPDERFGEEIMAWIVPREGAAVTDDDVRRYCEGRIAHYKVPRHVKLVAEFPMTVTGKVQKYKMREQAIAELGLRRAAGTRTA